MSHVFEVVDKKGRKIRLTRERWSHIRRDHENVAKFEEIEDCILNPDKIIADEREDVFLYFKYFKHKKQTSKFLKTIIKYLNSTGFILSSHFVRKIR